MKAFLNTLYVLIVSGTLIFFGWFGYTFYYTDLTERFYHPLYQLLKPSGMIGHGLGYVGTLLIIAGISIYMLRKRFRYFHHWGILHNWLNFHIFLCAWGSVMVLYHTSFKFGGIIAIGFWSLAVVVLSGIIGRYLYIQIPKSIEGRELTIREIENELLMLQQQINAETGTELVNQSIEHNQLKKAIKQLSFTEKRKIRKKLIKFRLLSTRRKHLDKMKRIFRYWHVIHLPFALIMLIIMAIHVGVVIYFGYLWI
jgi:hypothetical protein